LRKFSAVLGGDDVIIKCVKGTIKGDDVPEDSKRSIISLYQQILDVEDPKSLPYDELLEPLKPDSLLEKFAARKATKMAN